MSVQHPTFSEIHNNHDFRRAARMSETHPTVEAIERTEAAHQAFARGEIKTVQGLIDAMTGFGPASKTRE